MGIIKNKKRPWLEDDPEMQNRLWVEERQEDIKKILPQEQPIDRIPINCHIPYFPFIFFVLFFSVTGSGWSAGRGTPIFSEDVVLRYHIFIIILTVIIWAIDAFIYRKERGYIEIYPQMMVVYEYEAELKKLYLSSYHSWQDIIEYEIFMGGISIYFTDSDSVFLKVRRKKVQPYLDQYCVPRAQKLTLRERFASAIQEEKENKEWKRQRKKKDAEYQQQIKGYNEKKKELIEEARKKAQEMREQELREQELKEQGEEEKNNKE